VPAAEVRVKACSKTIVQLTSTSGAIKSPGYDEGTYPNKAFCQWRITAPAGSVRLSSIHRVKYVTEIYGHDTMSML